MYFLLQLLPCQVSIVLKCICMYVAKVASKLTRAQSINDFPWLGKKVQLNLAISVSITDYAVF